MTRIYPGTEITRTGTFRDSAGVLTDPTSVKYIYKIDDGEEVEATPTKQGTGTYDAVYTARQQKITAAMECLRIGLDQLAEHFGLVPRRRYQYAFHAEGYDVEVREDLWEGSKTLVK